MLPVLAELSLIWHRAWRNRPFLIWGATSFLLLAALMAYTLPALFLGHNNATYCSVQHFGRPDLVEFRSSSSRRYGLWVNLLGLYGFWPERLGRIPLLKAGTPWWLLSGAAEVERALGGGAGRALG